ncbi:hypothetical protein VD0002_g4558 [Verticillium dahliae]|uniref:Dicer-like protein 1 n=2 Tax=Verticillium dahliae TaxID=27337 RepID=G2WQ29_VERDV|nr:RNase3 domain-containing protein [Verticillium dahliae VdLs.17]KAH6710258.1 RNase3 domain-containing protein [Verticillium dahliae]EGY13789.1 RNase3 domain-containing protein [Verticillium dahliae VdLs.17]PNH34388.1 hypothetical protein BJF96_g2388 [Verticillium dahliae]PNH56986.1 hypothetical protein VD0003_g828 [Verticillium dahliae]PNH63924.1 hypothetical protein VD0002_g4558 [Verticillium dahliae]
MTTDELSVGLDATGISILADGPENISSSTSTSTTGKEDGYLCINRFTQNTATTQDNQSRDSDDDEDDCGSHDEADEDSDERQYSMTPERPHKITEKKRADHAAFHDWLQSNSSEIAQSTPQPAQNLNHTSTALMVRESENRKIIENPREYQIELFERAKRKNIIAVLPTGSGKTLIAALLLRHTLEQETADRRAGKPKRIAFFLVEKVALALQQHAVLECNLEFPIDRVCGDMVRSDWIKESWMKRWDDNMVMVCTAAILQQCLARSFIRMDQINLLVFDEAHHAKGNHPYARIIKDYYITEPDKERRPKIFGMTASPVDALTDVKIAAAQLEGLLHSEIATIEEDSVSFKQIQKEVVEQDCKYPALEPPFTTNLHKKIQEQVRYNKNFAKALSNSLEMSSSLGSWCVDRFWQIFLTEETLARLAAQTAQDNIFADRAEKERVAIEEVRNIIKQHQFLPITKTLQDLSSKVLCLLGQLELRFSAPTDHKCIIFVEKRNTAMILAHLLSLPGIGPLYLKPAALVGNPSDNSPLAMSYKEQVMTITKFRRGEYNCLLATSVAEEGIDIADCNIVIRFDLFNSVIQYIQSKGRARHLNSEYICMAELGNGKHTRAKIQANYDLSLIRQFCSTLPEDRKIVGWDPEAALHHGERDHKFHIVPSTGAKLTWTGSLVVLSNFASSLQVNDETLSPSYMVSLIGSEYICEVQLPSKSPILSVSGTLQKNKAEARCSAAFEMCMKLIKGGFISSHLQPTFTRKLPAMRNARLAISSKKRERYNMRVKPEVWSRRGPASSLFLTVLKLRTPGALNRPSQPLALLTREALPELPGVPLFFGNCGRSIAEVVSVAKPMHLDEVRLDSLRVFTLRIFKDVFSKVYDSQVADLPYFLAPAAHDHSHEFSPNEDPGSLIDWSHLLSTKEVEYLPWDEDHSPSFYQSKFVIDPYTGSRKLFLRGIRTDLKPTDLVPDGVPEPTFRLWKDVEHTIKEYSISLWAKSRARRAGEWLDTQPVVEAELVSLRRNLLDEFADSKHEGSRVCYVILQPLQISTLPVEVVAMAYNFPAIIHRIESNMIALDACRMLNLRVRPDLALEAMTKDSSNSEEHDQEKIDFQAGMGNNYERLEFLGDCFLKMATTIALFTRIPDSNEFECHVERMLLICNQNLFNVALKKNLQEYIRSKQFDRRSWYPQGLKQKAGKAQGAQNSHSLADKSIADVCEAIIGASYLSYTDEGNFDMAVRAVTAVVRNKNHDMKSYEDYYKAFKMPIWQAAEPSAVQMEASLQIKEQMGYEFKSPALLRSAFKHPSYPRQFESVPNYQRLEFLGDALLDMVCVDFLFRKFPDADPQWLTEHKMAMVSNHFLGSLSVELGFYRRVLHFNSIMANQIKDYVDALTHARQEAEAVAQISGTVSRDYWLNVKHPPKFLSDVVEAYIGAIFVDSGYDYGQVQAFFEKHIRPFFADMALYDSFASSHPVTTLARMMQQDFGCQDWRLLVSELPPSCEDGGAAAITETEVICGFMVHGRILLHAKSSSGRYAKVGAAKRAVEKLMGLGNDKEVFRTDFGCDCDCEGQAI